MRKYDVVAAKNYEIDGQEKTHWVKCGTVHQSQKGNLYMYLDAMPAFPEWNGILNFFEPTERDGQQSQSRPAPPRPAPPGDIDKDVPF